MNKYKCPNKIYFTLLKEFDEPCIEHLCVENIHTPAKILDYLSKSEDIFTLCDVASHKNTDPHTLYELSKKGSIIQAEITNNPNIPVDLLCEIAKKADPYTIDVLLDNPKIASSKEVLCELYSNIYIKTNHSVYSKLLDISEKLNNAK